MNRTEETTWIRVDLWFAIATAFIMGAYWGRFIPIFVVDAALGVAVCLSALDSIDRLRARRSTNPTKEIPR